MVCIVSLLSSSGSDTGVVEGFANILPLLAKTLFHHGNSSKHADDKSGITHQHSGHT